ncbi:MAG: hypothetical protein PHW82_03915 [Bacteroidales bacterium]|nr:hypothetical protein [Bacteroidales bacterium]
MKNGKIIFTVFLLAFLSEVVISQNVGISETPITPDASSILEVKSTNKGVLIPRLSLTGSTDNTSINSPLNSLLIFNTSTAGTSPNEVSPGYYYWSSPNSKWLRLCSDNDAWLLTGNSGTNPTTDFIGTTDAQDLLFKTNNTERLRIKSSGNVAIGEGGSWGKLTVNNGRFVVQNLDGYTGSGTSIYKDNPWVYLWSRETTLSSYQGGNIIFAAMKNSTEAADLCMIEGVRENDITNNTASKLSFYTRTASGDIKRRIIIDSNGHISFKPDNEANQYIIINDLGSGTTTEPTIVPSDHNYGFLGTDTRAYWRGYANSFISTSSKQWKTNITPLDNEERTKLQQDFMALNVVTYNPVRAITDTAGVKIDDELMPKTFGLISEDSPSIIVDESGNGIKLYEYISLLTVTLQEANKRIDELEAKILKLENNSEIKTEK